MRSWILWFGFLLVALFAELLCDALFGQWLAPPSLVFLAGLGVAMRVGPARGAWMLGVAGLLCDLVKLRPDGVGALAGVAVGAVAGMAGRRIVMEHPLARWFFVAVFMALLAALTIGLEWTLYRVLRIRADGAALAIVVWPLIQRPLYGLCFADDALLPQAWDTRPRLHPARQEEEEEGAVE